MTMIGLDEMDGSPHCGAEQPHRGASRAGAE